MKDTTKNKVSIFFHTNIITVFKQLIICWFLIFPLIPRAQTNITVSGYIRDVESGESLYGASVFDQISHKGCITNRYGFFSLKLPDSNPSELAVSYVGYESMIYRLQLSADTLMEISLQSHNVVGEVTVRASPGNTPETPMGMDRVKMDDILSLPGFLGEQDVIKGLTVLPGVSQGYEGSSGIYVRGGSTDQNLILLDGVPVYNTSHLFGFVSVFTPEALKQVDLYKGGFPARYGGRLSSVVDVQMKEGNLYNKHTSIAIGPISSGIMKEGPIKKGKSSYLISARRTLLDLLFTGGTRIYYMGSDEKSILGLNFYDLNGKFNFYINPRNRLYLSLYEGQDHFFGNYSNKYEERHNEYTENHAKARLKWGNTLAALRWNSQWSSRLFMNTTFSSGLFKYSIYDSYHSRVRGDEEKNIGSTLNYLTKINTNRMQVVADWYCYSNSRLSFGFDTGLDFYHPGSRHIENVLGTEINDGNGLVRTFEQALFMEYHRQWRKLDLNAGVRYETLAVDHHFFSQLSPRLNLDYLLASSWKLSASLSTMFQPIHLLVNNNIGLPSDIWVPATKKIKPETAWITSLGISHPFSSKLRWTMEVYFKSMDNVIQYRAGQSFMDLIEGWEEKVYQGKGRAYGVENALKFEDGQTKAWLNYTWGKNERRFAGLNQGGWFPYKFDRRHDINLGVTRKLKENVELTAMWVYQSGQAATIASGIYPAVGEIEQEETYDPIFGFDLDGPQGIDIVTDYNGARLPAFHHLDLSVTFSKQRRKATREWRVGIYNVYARQNAFMYYMHEKEDGSIGYKQICIFPVLPSVSYRLKF